MSRLLSLVAFALVLSTGRASVAQEKPTPPDRATVVVDGRDLFAVRGVSAAPAAARAELYSSQIIAAARDGSVGVDSIRVVELSDRSRIEVGERPLAVVVDADAEAEGVDRSILTTVVSQRISRAVQDYRSERTLRALALQSLRLLGAILAAAAALRIGAGLWRRARARVQSRVRRQLEAVDAQAAQLLRIERLWGATEGALRALSAVPVLIVAFVVAQYGLTLFPWTRQLSRRVAAVVTEPLAALGSVLWSNVPDLIFLVVWFLLVRYALSIARLWFAALGSGTMRLRGFDPEWADSTYGIVRLLVIALAVVIAFPYIPGSESQAFRGVSVFLGVLFSLGSTSVVSNVVAGYSMIYRRAFRVGDWVHIGDVLGQILEQRTMVTTLRTPKNETVVFPNSDILQRSLVNYSAQSSAGKLILHTTVGIGYETPWRQVEAMLVEAARRSDGVLTEPPPFVLEKQLGDFAVVYELNVYTGDPTTIARQYASIHRNVLDVFNEHGVQIMTPAYEADPPDPKVVARENWFAPPASEAKSPQATPARQR